MLNGGFDYAPATLADLDRLTDLRVAAMRESLERIGRFREDRARAWMARTYRPADTRLLMAGGELAGCVAFYELEPGVWALEHFYIDPRVQGRGLGTAVLRDILAQADAMGVAVRLTVVRESEVIRLYERHGFSVIGRDDIDVYCERPARPLAPRQPY